MTSEVTQAALEPCPLCHSSAVKFGGYGRGVYCIICKDCCIQTKFYPSRDEAANAWNTRLTAQSGEGRAAIIEECAAVADGWNPGRKDRVTETGIATAIRELSGDTREGRSPPTQRMAETLGARFVISGEGDDPHRILKNALFALEKLKAPAMIYGGVLTDGGKHAWLEYSLREQGDYSVFSGEGRSGAGEDAVARFGHHPDPATDFCIEVTELECIVTDKELGLRDDEEIPLSRIARAMSFRVGGDEIAVGAKQHLREIEERAAALNARQSGEGEREALREALAEAYRKGATDVHNYWVNNPGEPPRGDPEFGESASDYAAAALVIFDSATALRATDDAGGTK